MTLGKSRFQQSALTTLTSHLAINYGCLSSWLDSGIWYRKDWFDEKRSSRAKHMGKTSKRCKG